LELFSLIIDRVENTNIFNVIKGNLPDAEGHHLQSVLDGDLIREFLGEIDRIYRISNSLQNTADKTHTEEINLLNMLRVTGETFFEQFFPEIIQRKIRLTRNIHLFFNLDPNLTHIPWEIVHDGTTFLGDNFSIGKGVSKSSQTPDFSASSCLKMLIIADPTEELEWARKEGEELFERLSERIPSEKLNVELLGGSQITKLRLLNAIKGMDIIHYCGHLHYSMENSEENGWRLFGKKVLHAREIQKSGAKPKLVFSNSCYSGPVGDDDKFDIDPSSDVAASFLNSGILSYIGTNWEIPDNQRTLDFAIHFYEGLFSSHPIGVSLLNTRRYCRQNFSKNDLTWANYTLYGNPQSVIYKEATTSLNISHNVLKSETVLNKFPTPIALAYKKFLKDGDLDSRKVLENLFLIFENTMLIFGTVIFSNHRNHNLKERLLWSEEAEIDLNNWIDLIYESLYDIQSLKLSISVPSLVQTLYVHRDMIYKLLGWIDEFRSDRPGKNTWETYTVTFQYLLENLLMDSYFIQHYQLFYIFPDENEHLLFRGINPRKTSIFLPETEDKNLEEQISDGKGKINLFNPLHRNLISLSPYCIFEFGAGGTGNFKFRQYKCLELSEKIEK
jgi:hypothetical protein